jgi:protein-tyrosine phosphatase
LYICMRETPIHPPSERGLTRSTSNRVQIMGTPIPGVCSGGSELAHLMASRMNKWATEIIPDMLWLGSGTDASNLEELQRHNIRHVLNVSDDVPNFHEGANFGEYTISYLKLNVGDFGTDTGISRVFDQAFAFLDRARENNERILVHCAAGANRSASLVIAYLMHSSLCATLSDSWRLVKSKRRGVVPLKDNLAELKAYEIRRLGSSSIEMDDFFPKKKTHA